MFPGVSGFHLTAGNLIFVGAFFAVILILAMTIVCAARRSARDLAAGRYDRLRWKADFEDLAPQDRACRHVLSGELKRRVCPYGFDCRDCDVHPQLLCCKDAEAEVPDEIAGLRFPRNRFYHRGHTWVEPAPDGTVRVGLDELASRLLGTPDSIELPAAGTKVSVNGTAWVARRGKTEVRILSPVDGEVVETQTPPSGWFLRVRPEGGKLDTRHLLRGAEVRGWILRELDRLQGMLTAEATTPSLADGGVLVADLPESYPAADWVTVWGRMFLQP